MLLIGHGTRNPHGRTEFLDLAKLVASRLPVPLQAAFLELADPTIERGIGALVSQGVDRLLIAPLLLFAAGHAKQDVPAAAAKAAADCGAAGLSVHHAAHFGSHPQIVALAQRRLVEATAGRAAVPADQTMLVVVGRGSSDAQATAQMREFGRLLAEGAALPRVQVAFLAVAEPSIGTVLPAIPAQGVRRVIVHPHLLFRGELIEELERQTAQMAASRPEQEWIVSHVLADEEASEAQPLVEALADWIERETRIVDLSIAGQSQRTG